MLLQQHFASSFQAIYLVLDKSGNLCLPSFASGERGGTLCLSSFASGERGGTLCCPGFASILKSVQHETVPRQSNMRPFRQSNMRLFLDCPT